MYRSVRNPAQNAAMASLLAPALALGVSAALWGAGNREPSLAPTLAVVRFVAMVALGTVGLIAGVIALVQMSTYGRQGVLGRACAGLALSTLLLGLLSMGFLAVMHSTRRREAKRQNEQQIDTQLGRMDQIIRERTPGGPPPPEAVTVLRDAARAFEAQAQHERGAPRAVALVLARAMRRLSELQPQYLHAAKRFQDAGGASPEGLVEIGQIAPRLALLAESERLNEELDQLLKRVPADLQSELAKVQAPAADGQRALAVVTRNLNLDLNAQIRDDERKAILAMRKILTMLQDNWGRWRYDALANTPQFESTELQHAHAELVSEVTAHAEHQRQTQEQLLRRAQVRVPPP